MMLKLPTPNNTMFVVSMFLLIISNVFLRRYYKIEKDNKAKGRKFHVISIIIYSIAFILLIISFFKK